MFSEEIFHGFSFRCPLAAPPVILSYLLAILTLEVTVN